LTHPTHNYFARNGGESYRLMTGLPTPAHVDLFRKMLAKIERGNQR
jgi:hypothetical protein